MAELLAEQVTRAPHARGVGVSPLPSGGIGSLRAHFFINLRAAVERGVHARQVGVPPLEVVTALLALELLHHSRQVGGVARQRHAAVNQIDAFALDAPLVVLDAPLGRGAQVAQLDAEREGALVVPGLRGVLHDRRERAHVGAHRELRVLLQAAVLVLRPAAARCEQEGEQPRRHGGRVVLQLRARAVSRQRRGRGRRGRAGGSGGARRRTSSLT